MNNNNGTKKFKISDKTLTTLLYAGAAILVIAIVVVSIFAFASRNKKNETPTLGTSTTGGVTTTQAPVTTETPTTTTPSNNVSNVDKPTTATPTFVLPVEGVLSKTHDSETLVYSVTMNDYRVHLGIDVNAAVGAPVYAVADGKVKSIYQDYLMGQCIEIEHEDGLVSCYKNLGETLPDGITEGVSVKSGQLLGGVGETAIIEQCDESHLHFEMMKNGENVNPLEYISYGNGSETIEK